MDNFDSPSPAGGNSNPNNNDNNSSSIPSSLPSPSSQDNSSPTPRPHSTSIYDLFRTAVGLTPRGGADTFSPGGGGSQATAAAEEEEFWSAFDDDDDQENGTRRSTSRAPGVPATAAAAATASVGGVTLDNNAALDLPTQQRSSQEESSLRVRSVTAAAREALAEAAAVAASAGRRGTRATTPDGNVNSIINSGGEFPRPPSRQQWQLSAANAAEYPGGRSGSGVLDASGSQLGGGSEAAVGSPSRARVARRRARRLFRSGTAVSEGGVMCTVRHLRCEEELTRVILLIVWSFFWSGNILLSET